MDTRTPTNAHLAELLARESELEEGHRRRAFRRAARAALAWPAEAVAVAESGRSLTELAAVGPWVARRIHAWLEAPPEPPEPPELRAGFETMAEARRIMDEHADWRPGLRADLQMHTTWSDGTASVEEMGEAAAGRGYEHAAITDHSKGLPIARGMAEERLLEQVAEIDSVNDTFAGTGRGFRLLHSLEMNLSPTGEGDMDPSALGRLDLVLGAFHSRLRVTEDQTGRYIAALGNPDIHVLAHPRGRRWDTRLGLLADWPKVFEVAARRGVALEIDAFPDRQDLDVGLARLAAEAGAYLSLGTDAHRPSELAHMDLGLATAILGGVARERILNFLPREDLLAWARHPR